MVSGKCLNAKDCGGILKAANTADNKDFRVGSCHNKRLAAGYSPLFYHLNPRSQIAVLTRLTARPQSPRFPGITDTDRTFNVITSHFYNLVLTTGDTEECSLLQPHPQLHIHLYFCPLYFCPHYLPPYLPSLFCHRHP